MLGAAGNVEDRVGVVGAVGGVIWIDSIGVLCWMVMVFDPAVNAIRPDLPEIETVWPEEVVMVTVSVDGREKVMASS